MRYVCTNSANRNQRRFEAAHQVTSILISLPPSFAFVLLSRGITTPTAVRPPAGVEESAAAEGSVDGWTDGWWVLPRPVPPSLSLSLAASFPLAGRPDDPGLGFLFGSEPRLRTRPSLSVPPRWSRSSPSRPLCSSDRTKYKFHLSLKLESVAKGGEEGGGQGRRRRRCLDSFIVSAAAAAAAQDNTLDRRLALRPPSEILNTLSDDPRLTDGRTRTDRRGGPAAERPRGVRRRRTKNGSEDFTSFSPRRRRRGGRGLRARPRQLTSVVPRQCVCGVSELAREGSTCVPPPVSWRSLPRPPAEICSPPPRIWASNIKFPPYVMHAGLLLRVRLPHLSAVPRSLLI